MTRLIDPSLKKLSAIMSEMGDLSLQSFVLAIDSYIHGKNTVDQVRDISHEISNKYFQVADLTFEILLKYQMDNTARLNIWIDSKPLGQIRPSEYLIINLRKGKHHFKVLHIDVVNMRSEHEVEIDNETKVVKIKPTITSNKLEVTNEFPKNFDKFKYVEKR